MSNPSGKQVEPELKECPFCPHGYGFIRNESGRYNGVVWVECDWPSHAVRLVAGENAAPPCGARTAEYQTEQEAVKAWNTRVSAGNTSTVSIPNGQWQHVQIKAGNPRVVAIQFKTEEQATAFINSFAATHP